MRYQIYFMLIACCCTAKAEDALYERDPINYSTAPTHDPIAAFQHRIQSGKLKLEFAPKSGYLQSLLRELKVPVYSQVLVFSKTSFQRDRISPAQPRALYFNDEVYVGHVQDGDVLEIAATDPVNGPQYYTLDQRHPDRPVLTRETDACLQCHASSATHSLPGHVVRSVFPDSEGLPIFSAGSFRTDPSNPLRQRWGGWYVTGTSGTQRHMGNVVSADRNSPDRTDFTAGANLTSLAAKLDTTPYLSPHSDIVALMVLEHQAYVQNLITRASMLTRLAMYDAVEMNKALDRPADFRSDSTTSRIKNAVEPLLQGMLFCEETTLTDEIRGTSSFAEEFARRGPCDTAGRSLRQFDLKTRMFKYPCSYLIYSPSFDALPAEARERFWQRLADVLSGRDESKDFAHLTTTDRQAIATILRETKKDLPPCFDAGK